ncbi:unnamed protein product [Rhizopus stolonifer]
MLLLKRGFLVKKISETEEVCAIKIKMNLLLLVTVYFRSRKKRFKKVAPFASSMSQRSKAQWNQTFSVIYFQYLELLEFHSYVFEKDADITENDIALKIWSPILERLFRRTTLRTKWGKSVGDSNGVVNDRAKLHIESKIALDKLIKEVLGRTRNISIPSLQITGAKATLCSLKSEANGLYVGVKEDVTVIPNHVSRIKDFRKTVMLLYKFKNATMDVASFNLANDCDSNNNGSNNNNGPASWVRGTWIPPNTNKKTRLPNIPDTLYFSDFKSNT